jgi:endonuclease/exonuclease/phosphatase (EEP) superfamily protein YafD
MIVGDFNTPPESTIFPHVWEDYRDAFSAAGWAYGYTFFGSGTMVRIDHILAGKGWSCSACRVGSHVGSPHRPVIADLVWTGDNRPGSRQGPR